MDQIPITKNTISSYDENAYHNYYIQRVGLWNHIAATIDRDRLGGRFYHERIREIYRFLIPPGSRVLELGCGKGELLAAVQPKKGVGIDFSEVMIEQARQRHPTLEFYCADAHDYTLDEQFDYIILSDLVNDVWDVQEILENIRKNCHPGTRILLNYFSRVWLPLLTSAQKTGLAIPQKQQNWFSNQDIENLFALTGFDLLRRWHEILFPLPIPGLEWFCNKVLVKIWPMSLLGLSNFIIARPLITVKNNRQMPLASVIVPARNEAGNIPAIFERVPEMGEGTELIFVEGHSKDNTYQAIEECIAQFPERKTQLMRQDGIGKGDAVRKGFDHATGDVLMILDADLTVPPEDLPRFYQALVDRKGEFINGVRLVYPMEKQAMRFFNFLGNKFFSLAFSWILGQPVKDSLCGTKVMWQDDYQVLAANRDYFGEFDPFGDFDLLFGMAKLNRKIVDLPIRYRERTYGSTNIQRWKHGWLLIRMVLFSLFKIKFV